MYEVFECRQCSNTFDMTDEAREEFTANGGCIISCPKCGSWGLKLIECVPTQTDLQNLIEEIESCQDRETRAVLYRKYDEMTEQLKNQQQKTRTSCPECGNPDTVSYPDGLNEITKERGDECFRCYVCGVQFNVKQS